MVTEWKLVGQLGKQNDIENVEKNCYPPLMLILFIFLSMFAFPLLDSFGKQGGQNFLRNREHVESATTGEHEKSPGN